jgi:hypothetical protein
LLKDVSMAINKHTIGEELLMTAFLSVHDKAIKKEPSSMEP